MAKPTQGDLIEEYISLSSRLGKDEPTLTEFKKHACYSRTDVYNAFSDFNELKHRSLFKQGKRLYKSKDYLIEHYINREKSTKEIAAEWGVKGPTVHHWIQKHGLETRHRGEAQTEGDHSKLRNSEWMREEYIEKGRHSTEIADEIDVCPDTVLRWLGVHGIEVRDIGMAKSEGELEKIRDEEWLREQYLDRQKSMHQIASECNVQHSTVKRYLHRFGVETRAGGTDMSDGDLERLNDSEELTRLYWDEERPMAEIATELGVCMKTVHRKMQSFGIDRRGYEDRKTGPEHPLFKEDTISYYGYNWPEQRLKARLRDQCRCRVCGISDAQHYAEFGRVNSVHHIQPVSSFVEEGTLNAEQAHALENLITVCRRDHNKLEGMPIDNRV